MLSLDFSFNSLTKLKETLEALKHLPKLSNLLLIGNPLCVSRKHCQRCLVIAGFVLVKVNTLD